MIEITKLGAFILLVIGTIGLLVNDFILDWGRIATVSFAALNVLGLAILAFVTWGINDKKED